MDYDKSGIPSTYDAGRDVSEEKKEKYLGFFSERIRPSSITDILDLGCGTARFSGVLANIFGARVTGVDPSKLMLERARKKTDDSRITFGLASGEALPLESESIDMVFMSMVLHHLNDLEMVARECYRVLRSGGYVCVRNSTSDEIHSYPYLNFFRAYSR